MPPKTRFTEDDVIKAAFEIVRKKGLKGLAARRVAHRLKSSTAPVYRYFKNMKKLEKAVIQKIKELMIEYATTSYTDIVFLNMGTGIALFARDNKILFRTMFLEKNQFKDVLDEFLDYLKVEMKNDPMLISMSIDDRGKLLKKMFMFTHGLSSLICVGIIKDDSKEHIISTLREVGRAVIGAALSKNQENINLKECKE